MDFPERRLRAVDTVTLRVAEGERVALLGPSGAGKSTLLRVLLGAVPVTGTVRVNGLDPYGTARERREIRRASGFVRQGGDLVPGLSARLNAVMGTSPYWSPRDWARVLAGRVPAAYEERLAALADRHGITDSLPARVRELSGGQRQRVAVIRALLPGPRLLLADEPTSGLDPVTAEAVVDALCAPGESVTVVVATHDLAVARRFPRILAMRDGRLVHDGDSLDETAAAGVYGGQGPSR
ncbi:ATP-binding cassette domain-containing protein [Nonomuraea basaltis]|uniref:ATP-binding cassette domain-containing protein n=1 Tax=Nonomuraea basaltis TaxID=2495887 RepID=UPI001487233B|nr:ATP-binding cassette domain-containing protein [Nonomuraea basaltis]